MGWVSNVSMHDSMHNSVHSYLHINMQNSMQNSRHSSMHGSMLSSMHNKPERRQIGAEDQSGRGRLASGDVRAPDGRAPQRMSLGESGRAE